MTPRLHNIHAEHTPAPACPLEIEKRRTTRTALLAAMVLAPAAVWAFWPVAWALPTPIAPELVPVSSPREPASDRLDLRSFERELWPAPALPTPAPPPPAPPPKPNFVLLAVIGGANARAAIIYNTQTDTTTIAHVGSVAGSWTIRSIDATSATVTFGETTHELRLREEGTTP